MSIEEQAKRVVRAYVEAFNRGDLQALKSLLADDAEVGKIKRRWGARDSATQARQLGSPLA
jgi:ketosteroid isomerase-like protein